MEKSNLIMMAISFFSLMAFLSPAQSIWDMMFPLEDPLKVLELSPLSFSRAGGSDDNVLALARADWRETPTAHEISLDIRGMKKEDIKIEVEDNRVLRVSGERKTAEELKDERWHRVDRTVGKFWRQFRMPENADLEKVSARLEDGVLKIEIGGEGEKGA